RPRHERRARRLQPRLAGPPAPDLRALVAERRIGERLERLVQVAELVGDHRQVLARLLAAVESRELIREPVEALEQRLELPVGDLFVESRWVDVRTARDVGEPRLPERPRVAEHAIELDRDRPHDSMLDEPIESVRIDDSHKRELAEPFDEADSTVALVDPEHR